MVNFRLKGAHIYIWRYDICIGSYSLSFLSYQCGRDLPEVADDALPKGVSIKYPLQRQFKGQTVTHPPRFAPPNEIQSRIVMIISPVIPGVSERFLSERRYESDSIQCDARGIISSRANL